MMWVEALAKLILVMMLLALVVTATVVVIVVIKALIEVLIRRWRRKHGD